MKAKIILMMALVMMTMSGFCQFTFSVKPGFSMNGASFGYKVGRLVPFAGLQYYRTGGEFRYEHDEFNYDLGVYELVTHDYSYSAGLIMPNIGLKYFMIDKGKLKAHITANVAKPMIFAKAEFDDEMDEDIEAYVDGISLWGGEFSFGAEYFFDEHFSLGGEFGLRYMRMSFHEEEEYDDFHPITGEPHTSTWKYDMKWAASPSFSKISLNFYF